MKYKKIPLFFDRLTDSRGCYARNRKRKGKNNITFANPDELYDPIATAQFYKINKTETHRSGNKNHGTI